MYIFNTILCIISPLNQITRLVNANARVFLIQHLLEYICMNFSLVLLAETAVIVADHSGRRVHSDSELWCSHYDHAVQN